ncbi:TPA: arsenic resistance protein [Legionella pneumophila]|nr:arsenic resistance protein [Legionella pneumophila]HAU1872272.1 arsenic resistance protein [Legionella pneumophila]
MQKMRETFEKHQISIYFSIVVLAVLFAVLVPGSDKFEYGINPALAFMLFVTFLQVPLAEIGRALTRGRFLAALIITNFVALPLFVAILTQFLPINSLVRLGFLLVLLTPCIDYVVTFSHLGQADARLLLAATPMLLIVQLLLLPIYLSLFLGYEAAILVQRGPFIHAFVWLIAVPLLFAGLVELWAARSQSGKKLSMILGLMPVPATALVLFMVVASMLPQLRSMIHEIVGVIPFYMLFAAVAPMIGWHISRLFRLDAAAGRAIAFSAGTRNSLVILPLGLAVPGGVPVLPAIIITQTLVELISELFYVRMIAKFGD